MRKNWILAGIVVILMASYLFLFMGGNPAFALTLRSTKLVAIVFTGVAIAVSTVVFQTITQNKILTPSIMGLDSLYMLLQTSLVFIFGSQTLMRLGSGRWNFFLSVLLMMGFAFVLYWLMFKRNGRNIYFLLLVGIVCGTLFSSFASFMEMLIDPNEFQIVQDKMFASFNNVNTSILVVAIVIFIAAIGYLWPFVKYLDVLALGKDQAVNLGIPYNKMVKRLLMVIVVLVSVATALVGPITFLGLIVANVAYQFLRTHRHAELLIGASLISLVALVGGQLLAERIFHFNTPISVIINLCGGVYFLYLLLRGAKL
ncbi:iron chelate uptake ABC transporter family permease subunit [Listeria booriae]|uniref:Iron chelate uptake ABC transporter family permease subunit n=1 Tax=Listeria booriae TaxID=1552123 RepID=A0A7X1DL16_9LIST|nr:iron chelate uptake ABC transporter family permease subunit [Listeria booriae]MBC1211941.1 iron chelate uptake ABC transporter family permease subunit [Listeria booriae]MBC1917341.1 iron chelate uptake ABC transporter family permease subunit [Listeria booriae]MBC2024691.1 iron chelate uptake ABC transporter family permease subunit [Listeria booriae]MBC2115458.1 iron chelate uptake ABC transporter family permease subunit [Listeria booriae]MBC2240108.1 iron chelate uptake ABC transporter fami